MVAELIVAMAMFALAMVPLALTVLKEHRAARILYNRAVAGELLDGELEVLLAGSWTNLHPGSQPLAVRGWATNSLPPGTFTVSLEATRLRLEWSALKPLSGGRTHREAPRPDTPRAAADTAAPPSPAAVAP